MQNPETGNDTGSTGTTDDLRLWYDEPASEGQTILSGGAFGTTAEENQWQQFVLPIGNSYIGATIYGEVGTEHLTFNEKSLWEGGPSEDRPDYNGGNDTSVDADGKTKADYFREIQQLFLEGKDEEASALCDKLLGTGGQDMDALGAYQAWGDIYFDFGLDRSKVENYVRDLNLNTSVASVNFDYDGVNYNREYFISYPDNVMAIQFTAEGEGLLDIGITFPTAKYDSALGTEPRKEDTTVVDPEAGTLTTNGEIIDNQMKMCSQLKVVNTGGELSADQENGELIVSGADSVIVYVAAQTDYANDYPTYRTGETTEEVAAQVAERIDAAVEKGYDALKADHMADYRNIFDRMTLDLGQSGTDKTTDQLLAGYKDGSNTEAENRLLEVMLFQYGRYLTIASSREGTLPSNLQGLWRNRIGDSNSVPWGSDYHLNVNLQMNYWPAYVTNMTECAIPMIDYMESLREPGRVTAEVYAGVVSDEENPENGFMAHTQNTPFGWTCPGYGFNWGWSPAAVPWMLQNVWEYYEYTGDVDFMRENIYPMMKEEVTLYEQILVYDAESDRMVSAPSYSPEHGPRTIGNTYEQTLIWQLYEDTITAAEILGVDADKVEEWKETQSKLKPLQIGDDGQIKEWYEETTLGSMGGEMNHRHMSHLLGLYPGDLITVDDEEAMDAAIVSLEARGENGVGWGCAHRACLWARTGNGEKAYSMLQTLFHNGIYPNLWDAAPPFQIDGNFGMTAAVAEMLIQSNAGYINILPAMPEEWAFGSAEGLVARGNFEVDMAWENGSATEVKILSNNGGECIIQCDDISLANILDQDGNIVDVEVLSQDRVSFDTEAGESFTISMVQGRKLSAPKNVESYRTADASVAVSWEAVEGAESYNVYRQINDGKFRLLADGVTETGYVDETADPVLGDVQYMVAAVSQGTVGNYSDPSTTYNLNGLTIIDDSNPMVQYSGWSSWSESKHYGGSIHFVENSTGKETITTKFYGTGIQIYTPKHNQMGYLDIYIDGELVQADLSLYDASSTAQNLVYEKTGMKNGLHTITVVGNGKANPDSGRSKVEFDYFRVIQDTVQAESVEISSVTGATTIGRAGGTLQLQTAVLPENAANAQVNWSVSSDLATIDANGLLTAGDKNGTVTVTATAADGSGATDTMEITIQVPGGEVTEESWVVDDRDEGIAYSSGQWKNWEDTKHLEGTIMYTDTAGASVSYTFEGTGIEVIVPKTHLSAQVQVTIDEEDVGIYDAYAEYPGETQQVLYSNKQLGDGTHTITLTVVQNGDNTHLELDAFRVYQKIMTGETMVDDSDPGIQYSAGWSTWPDEKHYNGGEHYTQAADETITYEFNGTGIEVIGMTTHLASKLEVTIDGAVVGEVSTYQTSEIGTPQTVFYSNKELENGPHIIELKVLADENRCKIEFDAFRVFAPADAPVDKAALQTQLEAAAACDSRLYSEDSWAAFETALTSAAAVMNDAEADQTTVDQQAEALAAAIAGLIPVEDTEAPAQVTGLKAVGVEENTLVLTWEESTDNIGLAGYTVTQDGTVIAEKISDLYFRVSGLENDTEYKFQVTAYDINGNASEAAELAVRTLAEENVKQPINIQASDVTENSAVLTWEGQEGVSYQVFVNGVRKYVVQEPTVTLEGLETGKSYAIRIIAADAAGEESIPGVYTLTTAEAGTPEEPADLTALNALIQEAAEYEDKLDQYTEETALTFRNALEAARAVAAGENPTESDIQNAWNALKEAIDGLVPADPDNPGGEDPADPGTDNPGTDDPVDPGRTTPTPTPGGSDNGNSGTNNSGNGQNTQNGNKPSGGSGSGGTTQKPDGAQTGDPANIGLWALTLGAAAALLAGTVIYKKKRG
ncbi:MAG TPA: glycoside hydrolase N-terminal domain-containing protein [Candidatus Scatomonas merdavium]|nr:glycoside hydrolase N-terminal domain-containing protein [Candidatus Scatomonas merdavium]